MSDPRQSSSPGQSQKIAVLLLAYGGPASLDEVGPYVMDVRGGRPLSPELLDEIRDRYRQIGGKSPLLQITQAQAIAVEEALERKGISNKTFVGMRHWFPYIKDAVRAIVGSQLKKVVAVCMAPQYSNVSIGAYRSQYDKAVLEIGATLDTIFVDSWHNHPDLLRAFAGRVTEALQLFPADERASVFVLFTAHSLPRSRIAEGDPYDRQQQETAEGVARLANLQNWSFAYQSQGYSKEPWLGPSVEEKLRELAEGGIKNVIVAPTGFVCDHIEILYDVDIAFRKLARSLGMRLERTRSLNDDPLFIRAVAGTVRAAVTKNRSTEGGTV